MLTVCQAQKVLKGITSLNPCKSLTWQALPISKILSTRTLSFGEDEELAYGHIFSARHFYSWEVWLKLIFFTARLSCLLPEWIGYIIDKNHFLCMRPEAFATAHTRRWSSPVTGTPNPQWCPRCFTLLFLMWVCLGTKVLPQTLVFLPCPAQCV